MSIDALTYGSDLSGLICGYVFQPGIIARPLSSQEVENWIHNPERRQPDAFIWLHFNLANATSEKWLKKHIALSEVFYDALHDGTRSTRIDYADNTLIAVLNDVLFDFSFDASDISTLWLSVDEQVVITARTKPLLSVDRLREAVKRGETLRSTADLLIHLLRDEADVLIQIVRDIAARVDNVEDHLLSNRLERNRTNIGNWRRLLLRLQRLLAPEPAALFRLLNRPPAWIAEHDVLDLRQSTEEFSTVLRDMSSLQERIKLLQEEIAAQINEQNNRSLFVLTIVSVLVLPINIISGLMGMNVGGIPFNQEPGGFWIVVAIAASLTFAAGWWAFRKTMN